MPADPTDEAVAAMRKALGYPNSRRSRSLVKDALDAIPTDVLARVVAGRPNQPTIAGKVDHVRYREDDNETVIEVHVPGYCAQAFNHPALWDRRVTVYATDPHTPGQETPDA